MRNALCVCYLIGYLLHPSTLSAQAKPVGWGPYHFGTTTPDSLDKTSFHEQPQPLVKGTIALPCSHIRIFQADTVRLENLTLTNLLLAFYDNHLFKLVCNGNVTVRQFFNANYSKGTVQPIDTLILCKSGRHMVVQREVWHQENINVFFVHAEGYTTVCQPIVCQKLILVDQRILALTSECDWNDEYLLPIVKH